MPTGLLLDLVAPGVALLLLDQWSKGVVRARVGSRCISCGPILQIRCATHLKDIYNKPVARVLLALGWFAALASAILLHRLGSWFQSPIALFGIGIALGGAAGNLSDILRRRAILDFLYVRRWSVFNFADVAIVSGLILAFWRHA